MYIFTYISAYFAVIYAITSLTLLIHRTSVLKSVLSGYLFTLSVWAGSNTAADVAYTSEWVVTFSGIAFVAIGVNLFLFLILIDLLVEEKFPNWKRLLLYAVPNITPGLFAFSSYAVIDVSFPISSPTQIEPGILYSFGLLLITVDLTYGAVRMFWKVRTTKEYTRKRGLLFASIGLILTMSGLLLFDVILPLLGETRFYSLGPVTSVFFAAGCGLAVGKYQLLSLKVTAHRGIVYSFLISVIIACYLFLLHALTFISGSPTLENVIFSAGVATVFGVFSATTIESYLSKVTNPLFFNQKYDYPKALHALSVNMSYAASFKDVIDRAESGLSEILKAKKVNVVLGNVSEDMKVTASLYAPLLVDGSYIGAVCIGEKKSGDEYSHEDQQLLDTFAYQAANSLSRVHLYQEIEQHARDLEVKIRERTKELYDSRERERQIINDVSHGLQTPLTILQTRIDSLKPLVDNPLELHQIEQSLTNFSSFIYELLSLAELDTGILRKDMVPVSLSELLKELCEEVDIISSEYGARISCEITSDIWILCDRARIRESLMNLASNSLKYLSEERAGVITFNLKSDNIRAILQVTDNGMGIDNQDISHIFERFYRGKNGTETTVGTGLGLAITKRIIEQHGGTVTVLSKVNEGSTFEIRIPVL